MRGVFATIKVIHQEPILPPSVILSPSKDQFRPAFSLIPNLVI